MAVKIPLRRLPSDIIGSTVEGIPLQFRNKWNDRDSSWHVDILTETGDAIVLGLKLLSNVNLTNRYVDERLPATGDFYSVFLGAAEARPTYESLGDSIQLWFIPDSDFE